MTVTLFVCKADDPQALFALTVTLPLALAPVPVMLVPVLVPLQPDGKVHV